MINVAVFDSKPDDQLYLEAEAKGKKIRFHYHAARLNADSALLARDCQAACIFVNDLADRAALKVLREQGVGLLALRCAGFNQVDLEAARELGMAVVRVPAYSPNAVAEHALALYLCLNRKIHRAYNRVREFNFSLHGLLGSDLAGKTVGVVGTGRIGRVAAKIFKGFETEVLAVDPARDNAWARKTGVRYTSMRQLLEKSDVITLHTPLTPKTFHLINATALRRMKKGAVIINTSRGKLVDTKALIKVLKSGKLGGVALDVYEEEAGVFFEDYSNEMIEDDQLARLLTFPNVLMTSHQGFFTREAMQQISSMTVGNLERFGQGKKFLKETDLLQD